MKSQKNHPEKKRIIFITATRADFGKMKSLIRALDHNDNFEVHVVVTGMHMMARYGSTYREVEKSNFRNIHKFKNQNIEDGMDRILANSILKLSGLIKSILPDMIIYHGDRVEALAAATVGSLNNILSAHIEGGEVSGTVDELIRHSVSKLSHIHFVSNKECKARLIQLGETSDSIKIIGSPDIDIMLSSELPNLVETKKRYEIVFNSYAIALFHPVTTEYEKTEAQAQDFVRVIKNSNLNYVVIHPNNDLGSEIILNEYRKLKDNDKFKLFPSIRFECFITLLKNANFLIGNSSAGIREAPYFGVPTIDIGTRQNRRAKSDSIFHSEFDPDNIEMLIQRCAGLKLEPVKAFGKGRSDKRFLSLLSNQKTWKTSVQKTFVDL